MQDDFFPVDDDGVSRIMTALVPSDDIERGRYQVDNFALSFIAPLGPDDK